MKKALIKTIAAAALALAAFSAFAKPKTRTVAQIK